MPNLLSTRRPSLAELRTGDEARIDGFLFGSAEEYCGTLGLEKGTAVRCRNASRSILLLDVPDGRTVVMDVDWARFIVAANPA